MRGSGRVPGQKTRVGAVVNKRESTGQRLYSDCAVDPFRTDDDWNEELHEHGNPNHGGSVVLHELRRGEGGRKYGPRDGA